VNPQSKLPPQKKTKKQDAREVMGKSPPLPLRAAQGKNQGGEGENQSGMQEEARVDKILRV